ncbi:hypothetical protein CcaverHIS002_0108240 [Cutaneotrichosporon cavernicola]|nr:hypothetical protein CcaverHIS002_0108240 [Cutaneotrichosporon cavernicola]
MGPMPKIIYGTAWKKDQTAELVYTALKSGFRGIDTACQPKTRGATLEAYRALEKAVQEGKVGGLGVSNIYNVQELAWLVSEAKVPLRVVQNRWYEGNSWDWQGASKSSTSIGLTQFTIFARNTG